MISFFSTSLFCQVGALQLQYQREVDSLAARYPNGITSISGELIIGPHRTPGPSPDYDITDLSALRRLKRIGALIVDGNPELTSLNALDSVFEIAAYLTVSNNPKLEDVDFLKDVGGRPYSWLTIRNNPLIKQLLLDSFPGCGRYANITIWDMPLLDTIAMPSAQGVWNLNYNNLGIKHLDSTSIPFTGDQMVLQNLPNLESMTLRRHGVDTNAISLDQVNWTSIQLLKVPLLQKITKSEFWGHGRIQITGAHSLPTVDSIFQSAFYYRSNRPWRNGSSISYSFQDIHSIDSIYVGYPNLPGEQNGIAIRNAETLRVITIDSSYKSTFLGVYNAEAFNTIHNLSNRSGEAFIGLTNTGISNLPVFNSLDSTYQLLLLDNKDLQNCGSFLHPNSSIAALEIERNYNLKELPITNGNSQSYIPVVSVINNPSLSPITSLPIFESTSRLKSGYFSQVNKQRTPADSTEDFSRYFPSTLTVIPVPKHLRYLESHFELGIGGNVILPAFDSLRYFRNAPLTRTTGDPLDIYIFPDYSLQLPEGTPFPLLDTAAAIRILGNSSTYPPVPDITFPSLAYHDWVSYSSFSSPNTLPQPFTHEVPTSYALNTAGDTILITGLFYLDLKELDTVPTGLDSTLRNQGLFLGSMSDMTNCDILCEYIRSDLFKIELLILNDNPTPECSDVMMLLQHCQVVDTENPTVTHQFHIGPNPTSDFVTMFLDSPLESHSIAFLVSAQGEIVHQQQLDLGTQQVQIDLSHLPNGSYALAIKGQKGAVMLLKIGAE
ncbi:MAG: T9SS type A sorting domain-containing protein [Saprospiraceae bacterium]